MTPRTPTRCHLRATWNARRPRSWGRAGREDGYAAAEYAAGVGFLILPVTVLVLTLPTWVETQTGARLAAQQAARAVVTAPTYADGIADASAVVATVLGNLGIEQVGRIEVDGALRAGGENGGQELVTVAVTVRMPAISFPLVRDVAAFDHTVSHTQPVDLYRTVSGG